MARCKVRSIRTREQCPEEAKPGTRYCHLHESFGRAAASRDARARATAEARDKGKIRGAV